LFAGRAKYVPPVLPTRQDSTTLHSNLASSTSPSSLAESSAQRPAAPLPSQKGSVALSRPGGSSLTNARTPASAPPAATHRDEPSRSDPPALVADDDEAGSFLTQRLSL
jgi:hypothetical protein